MCPNERLPKMMERRLRKTEKTERTTEALEDMTADYFLKDFNSK